MAFQILPIFLDTGNLPRRHAPRHLTGDGGFLVAGKIHAGLRGNVLDDARLYRQWQLLGLHVGGMIRERVDQGRQFAGNFLRRQHKIRPPNANGGVRHAVIFGRGRILGDGHATSGLDRFDAARTIRAGAGQHDGNTLFLTILRQAEKQQIHRRLGANHVGGFSEGDFTVANRNVGIRRCNVNHVGTRQHVMCGSFHLERGFALQQLHHHAAMIRRHVLRQHIRDIVLWRQIRHQQPQRFQPARRRTDANIKHLAICNLRGLGGQVSVRNGFTFSACHNLTSPY